MNEGEKLHKATICKDITFTDKTKVWKISLGDKNRGDTPALRNYCFKNGEIRIGWGAASTDEKKFSKWGENDKSSIRQFRDEMQIDDWVVVLKDQKTIKGIGIIKSKMKQTPKEEQNDSNGFCLEEFQSYRRVEWINNEEHNILSLNDEIVLTQKTVYPLQRIKVQDILDLLGSKD